MPSRVHRTHPRPAHWLLSFLSTICAAQDTTGSGILSGSVTSDAGTPVPSVEVCLEQPRRCVTTDDAGRFRFAQLRSGPYRVSVSADSGQSAAQDVELRAGLESRLQLILPANRQSITVAASDSVAGEEISNSAYLVRGTDIFRSAGTLQDAARFVQTLPGVAIGSDDFRNDIIVRGGSPLENLFIVDNVEVPNINTFANFASAGGTVSILDPNMIRDVTFLTGGYPAPFGNRTSSVLQITQREGERDRIHGRANVLFSGAGALLEGPFGRGKGSWIVSARRSFLDLVTNDTGIGGVPVLYTFNAKVTYDLTPSDRIWLVNLTGLDNIRLGLTEDNRSETDSDVYNYDIRYRGRRSATGLNWQHLFGTRAVGLLGVTNSQASVDSSVRDLLRAGIPAPSTPVDSIIAASPQVFREDSGEGETTVKYDTTVELSALTRLQAGGNFKLFRIRYGVASPFGNDSPYSSVPGLGAFALDRRLDIRQGSAYAQAARRIGNFNLTAGLRVDRYGYLGETRASPRAGLRYRLTERLTWSASYGTYYQQPFFLFLAAFDENRRTLPFRATHYVTGLRYQWNAGLRFGVELYRKNYRDYPVARDIPALSLANLGDTFNVREILFPIASAGRGNSQGIEFSAEKTGERWFGQANFGLFRTRHAALDGLFRPGSFDYPRVLNLIGGYRFNPKWELGLRMNHLSGRPYTPFDIPLSIAQRRGIYDLGRVNGLRLPDYFRLDARLDRTFYIGKRAALLFLGVQNLTGRRNLAGYQWNRRTAEVIVNRQLGVFPLAGFEYRF